MAGDRDSEDVPTEDELTRRLRELEWPKPPPGVRERSLEEFRRRIAAEDLREADPVVPRKH
ncbi:MAG TPA: hypothetical protein VGW10_08040 [Solirubrobacteraceae bacterium]|nr:hypothetical protein [Solirubrobacteraceae bacterium]